MIHLRPIRFLLLFLFTAIASIGNAAGSKCSVVLVKNNKIPYINYELVSGELIPEGKFTPTGSVSKSELILTGSKVIENAIQTDQINRNGTIQLSRLKNGNIKIVTLGFARSEENLFELVLGSEKKSLDVLSNELMQFPNSAIQFSVSGNKITGKLTPLENLGPEMKTLTAIGIPNALSFTGKHSYLPFKFSLQAVRNGWDNRFPLNKWTRIGLESPFGTRVEDANNLIGLEIVGIAIDLKNEGKAVIEKPLENAKIFEFNGSVTEIIDINKNGPDPIWVATINSVKGEVKKINLTDAIGLRAKTSGIPKSISLSGTELIAANERRQRKFEEYRNIQKDPPSQKFKESFHDKIVRDVENLPPEQRLRVNQWRTNMLQTMSGNMGKTQFEHLTRTPEDLARRPIKELSDESKRPFVEETHRLLFDTDSPDGYNQWLIDLATKAMIKKIKSNSLQWGQRVIETRDIHYNFPYAEGMHGIPTAHTKLENVPLLSEKDLLQAVDSLAKHYGFDKNLGSFPKLKLQPGTKSIGTLEGISLEESTPFFFEYSRNHILFLDNYFKRKPHGQYAHIMQWLYLAERYSHPSKNKFGASMLNSLFDIQAYFMDDMLAGVVVTDFVGQRAPQNPDHINNTLQLFFPVD
ncbi:MAG: hypothetical protein V4736_00875 [Bdellovibrionota bacterium]